MVLIFNKIKIKLTKSLLEIIILKEYFIKDLLIEGFNL